MIKAIYDLDMTPRRTLPIIINVSQYDDIGRTLVFNLFSSSGKWTAPTSAAVTFEGGKPDGKFFSYNCAYSNGTVTVTIQQQMTAVAGKVRCKIKVKSGDKVVESAPIIMIVDAAAVPDGSDMSKSDINDAIANATQKIVDQVKDTIPSDYAQLSTDVSSLKQDIDNTKSQLSDVTNVLTAYDKIEPLEIVDGKLFELSKKKHYDSVTSCYTKTEIPTSATKLKISGRSASAKYDYGIGAFYDDDWNYLSSILCEDETEYTDLDVEVPLNAKYIVVNFYMIKNRVKSISALMLYPVAEKTKTNTEDVNKAKEQISYVQKDIRDILKKFEFDVELSMVGYLAANPKKPTYICFSNDTNGRCSDYIKCNDFAFLDVVLYGNEWVWQVAFYDKDKAFIPQISISGNESSHKYSVDIPSEAIYLRLSSFNKYGNVGSAKIMFSKENIDKSIADLNERVSNLEADTISLFENTEFALFHTFGIIGDSLSVGHTVSKDGQTVEGRNIYYSWGQYLARRLGNNCLNFGRSGVSAKLWMSTSEQYCYPRLVDPNNLCQAYIIALGANDASMTLGSIADVNFSDMTQNADTEYGWYAKVINAVRTTAPNAPIFLFTLPYPRNGDDNIKAINEMIRVFGSDRTHFGKIFVVDLDANYNEYFKNGKLLNQIGNTGWHLTSLGYMYASHVNQKALSKVIADNYSDFQDVFTLPYGSNTILD